jgi:hypothetical protein
VKKLRVHKNEKKWRGEKYRVVLESEKGYFIKKMNLRKTIFCEWRE